MAITLDGTSGLIVSGNTNTLSGITVGRGAGSVATNTAVGQASLYTNTTGSYNTALGRDALRLNTTASYNTAVGYQAAYSSTGQTATAFGARALYSNTTGIDNVAMGYASLYGNTTGGSNVAVGHSALQSNTTASNNTAVGYQAGYTNATGTASTYLGKSAGYSADSSYNTMIGDSAGYYITSGAKNTILGRYNGNQGGLDIRTASNYIVLSDGDGNPRLVCNSSGEFFVDAGSFSYTAANLQFLKSRINIGSAGTGGSTLVGFGNGNGQVGTITVTGSSTSYNTSSDYRLKNSITPMTGALAKVAALNPVTYKWNADDSDGEGFIAHELAEVCPHAVTGEKDAVDADGNPVYQGIDVSFLVGTLTAAIKELKAEFDAYKATHP